METRKVLFLIHYRELNKKMYIFFFHLWYSSSKNLDFLDKSSKWTKHSKMEQLKFVEDSLYEIWKDMVCLSKQYLFTFFKGCLPQILLDTFLKTLSQIESLHLILNSRRLTIIDFIPHFMCLADTGTYNHSSFYGIEHSLKLFPYPLCKYY